MTSTLQGQAELRRNDSQPILDRPDKLNDPSFLLTLHRWASPTRNRAGSTTPNGPVGLGLTRSPHDPFILITLNQLGTVYHAANKPAAAKTVFQRSLSAAETARGLNNTSALKATFNLACYTIHRADCLTLRAC
ncbi:tetratricopeptide repeat protein [Aspergillus alliaceus]|uniref:tetratricopeptide repeat protein n=1 Tax=Petromyces alliaceus TaxID=209559 RepID=UPI0012A72EE0|nr:uncharacterized protein BDW43DRAFT_305886 [Aspergillus alliaceus]KAB8239000.1 hypothetical protein BDW43DRAFT_305886 [Aspergillus alliaceus]